jgi:hypothetical protein
MFIMKWPVSLQPRDMLQYLGKLSKFWYVTLQTLNVGTSSHTVHVNPMVHFCPDSLQHAPVYGCHSGDDALSQFLKIIWQGWYVDDVLDMPPSRCTYVTELVFANCRIQNDFCCEVAILQYGLPWRRPETLSRVNYNQTLRVFLTAVVYRAIVDSLVTSL